MTGDVKKRWQEWCRLVFCIQEDPGGCNAPVKGKTTLHTKSNGPFCLSRDPNSTDKQLERVLNVTAINYQSIKQIINFRNEFLKIAENRRL